AEIAQAALQHHRLAQPFDIAAGERQLSELQRGRFSWFPRRPFRRLTLRTLAAKRKPERHDERADQDGVRQRIGRRVKRAPVRIELGERLPELWTRLVMQLRRQRFEQAGIVQRAKWLLRRS